MPKLKTLKGIIKRYKLISIMTLVFIALIPLFVLAVNDPQTGYRAYKSSLNQPMFYVAEDGLGVERVGFCVNNASSNDYFIPTAKFVDTQAFFNHKPSGVSLVECDGDGQCTSGEDCSNAPSDCGTCTTPTNWDICYQYCFSDCPCSYCTQHYGCPGYVAPVISGGGGGGGGGSCGSYPLFLASCG